MTSTRDLPPSCDRANWEAAGLRYYSLNSFLTWKFGRRVWKVSVDAGLSCPNRDGSAGTGGCVFCDPKTFSPSRRLGLRDIGHQIDQGTGNLQSRHQVDRFLAYFQPATNTYGPIAALREAYRQALSHPLVVGLIVGTRPDCVPDDVLDLLAELAKHKWVSLELGLQSIHERSLEWMNRGHDFRAFVDAVARSQQRHLHVGAHVILGLPGESRDDMLATARVLADLGIDSVKLHNLYAVENTPLAAMVAEGSVRLLALDQYVPLAVDFLEELPPDCVVDRLSGDAPRQWLVGPAWCLDKQAIHRAIRAEFERRGTRQGGRYRPSPR